VLVDYLVGAGIKPLAITSYNHLGNRDGQNLSEAAQLHSKIVSKAAVVEEAEASTRGVLYSSGERIAHNVVIKCESTHAQCARGSRYWT
jgi:myo-inositol-1-phosphate synthase